jgi:Leucine-rich repeat (LRR) protein
MKHLQSLWVPNNNITSIPANIAQLTELTLLNISYNQITEFPASILTGVTSLNMLMMD